MKLSEHFTLAEYTVSETASRKGIDNDPKEMVIINNLKRMAAVMEEVRLILGKHAITVTSGYRCPELNTAIGSGPNSAHINGLATDFICPGYGVPYDICRALEPLVEKLGIDQLIFEFRRWVHIGLRDGPRHQVFTINEKGTSVGIVL
jgi:hypothetical protein